MNSVCVVINDLILGTRIRATAERALWQTVVARNGAEIAVALDSGCCRLVIVDMETAGPFAVEAIEYAVRHALHPRVVAVFPHVRDDFRQAAMVAGATEIWPRSKFAALMAELFVDHEACGAEP